MLSIFLLWKILEGEIVASQNLVQLVCPNAAHSFGSHCCLWSWIFAMPDMHMIPCQEINVVSGNKVKFKAVIDCLQGVET
jgi:hypothetical protein